jgi:inositol-hexakisphosphate/diphosphoinositol-pentakisphosphate 1-kinase
MWWKYCDLRDFDFWRWKDYGIKHEENMTYYWRHVRSRLYFTSSSHMYALFNMLFYLGQEQDIFENKNQFEELCNIKTIQYLSHFVFKLFEDLSAKTVN